MTLYTFDREKREKRMQALMADMGMALPSAPPPPPPEAFLERPLLAETSPDMLPGALPGLSPGLDEPPCAPLPPDRGELLRQLETLRERFDAARAEPLEALLILAEVERGTHSLRDGCKRLNLNTIADVLGLLSSTLKRTEPLNNAHMELLSLQLEAVRALFRLGSEQMHANAGAGSGTVQGAGEELLHALRAAVRRQFHGLDAYQ